MATFPNLVLGNYVARPCLQNKFENHWAAQRNSAS